MRISPSLDPEASRAPSGEKVTLAPPFTLAKCFPSGISHKLTPASSEAEASSVPSGEKANPLIVPVCCPDSFSRVFPPETSQSHNSGHEIITLQPDASAEPSGEKAILWIH